MTSNLCRGHLSALGFCFVSFLGLAQSLSAQSRIVRFDRLSLEKGLSQATITAIAQDRRGFMWFGTQDGLNRYDGYSFTVFKHDDEDPSSLSHNFVVTLHEDGAGALWVGTSGGLNQFDPAKQVFQRFEHDPGNARSLSHDYVTAIYEDRARNLWIGTKGGLNRFDRRMRSFERFRHDPSSSSSLSHDHVMTIYEDQKGVLWIGSQGGLDRFDPKSRTFTHYRHDPGNPESLSDDRVSVIQEDEDGSLWVGTLGGANRFDRRSERFDRFLHDPSIDTSLSSNRVWVIDRDSAGTLWFGTENGLNEWRPAERRFERRQHDPTDPGTISSNEVWALFQDRGGVMWVGTSSGLNKWNPKAKPFRSFTADGPNRLSNNWVSAFAAQGDGVLWVGTLGGLNRFHPSSGRFTLFTHDPANPASLGENRIISLLADDQGSLWVGTGTGVLDRFDGVRFHHYRHRREDPTSLSGSTVNALLKGRNGFLWVGTDAGLNRLDRASSRFKRYRHDPSRPGTLSDDRVFVIYEDKAERLWVGTFGGGLNRFDTGTDTFVSYRHDSKDPTSLASDTICSIYEDPAGALWIGTDSGLNRWDPADRVHDRPRFERYNRRDGLPNDVVYGIRPDGEGNLWISTNNGLSKFNPASRTFRNFTAADGLQGNEFNAGAHFQSSNGEMFFGGVNGFTSFFPGEIRDNSHVPPVVLTGFWKLNQKVALEKPLWEAERIKLSWRDYVVSFEFAALDYTAPDQNRYAYKLEGFDKDWNELGNLRRAVYTNLDPGNYVLRVKAANNDGVWNQTGLALDVNVFPPPWKTWWAYALYGLTLVGVVLGYTRAQARKLAREAEYSRKLEQQVQERTSELARRNDELSEANRKLEEAALTDSMTGLRNRRYLMTYIKEDLALVERQYKKLQGVERRQSTPDFLFLMIDLDGFKGVNDAFGHGAGDRVLLQVRDLLEKACRKSDTIIRWGGDEFMVVGRSVDRDSAETMAERIRSAISGHRFDLGVTSVGLGCSVGFAFYPFVDSSPAAVPGEQVMTIADRALYVAKASGRNAWVGLYATESTPLDGLVRALGERLEGMVADKSVELSSSFEEPTKLVLDPEGRTKALSPRDAALAEAADNYSALPQQ